MIELDLNEQIAVAESNVAAWKTANAMRGDCWQRLAQAQRELAALRHQLAKEQLATGDREPTVNEILDWEYPNPKRGQIVELNGDKYQCRLVAITTPHDGMTTQEWATTWDKVTHIGTK